MRNNALHIVICDDETSQISLLENYVEKWAKECNIEVFVQNCRNADQFLFLWEERKDVDILLLDIEMPGMDGMALAKRLRNGGEQLQILFITGIVDYVMEGYDVEAVSYLLKPVKEERFFECMERARKRIGREEAVLLLEAAGEVEKIRLKDISYLESDGHDTLVYQDAKVLRSKLGIQKLEKEITEKSGMFYKIHRSYLINFSHIQKITRKEVQMDTGAAIPIPRGKWEALNQAYLNFYRKNQEI